MGAEAPDTGRRTMNGKSGAELRRKLLTDEPVEIEKKIGLKFKTSGTLSIPLGESREYTST